MFKLYQGNCLDIMPTIEHGSVDMVLADPPYGNGITACKWDVVIPFDAMWSCLNLVKARDAAVVMTCGQPFTSQLVLSNLKNFKFCLVYDKVRPSGMLTAKYKPMMRHEDIAVFSDGKLRYTPVMELREKPVRGTCFKHSDYISTNLKDGKMRTYTHKYPQSILRFIKDTGLHPTQKPVKLLEYLIKNYTKEGDTVLDFTMGSGSTGVACANTGRRFIGIELDLKYYNIASERIMSAYSSQPNDKDQRTPASGGPTESAC